jgi:hypothetical protein
MVASFRSLVTFPGGKEQGFRTGVFRYGILGAGRQGTAAAYDLVVRGEAEEVVWPISTNVELLHPPIGSTG